MKKIYAEGHRGMCAYYPENTMISYEKAMETGVDAIECAFTFSLYHRKSTL